MADQIDARELASYQKASVTPLASGSSALVGGGAIDSPLQNRFVVFPCPNDTGGADPRVRIIRVSSTQEKYYLNPGEGEDVIQGLAIYGSYIDGVIRGGSFVSSDPRSGDRGWITSKANPSFILITKTSADIPEVASSGRYVKEDKLYEIESSYKVALEVKNPRPDARPDIAANSAHESARNNIEHVTHSKVERIKSNFKGLDENSIRRIKQEYPRLSQYTEEQIKKRVISLLEVLQKNYATDGLLQSYLSKQKPFGENEDNLKLFENEGDEDIRRLTLRLFSGAPTKATLVVDSKPQYLVVNSEDIHDKVQKDLLEFWKVHDPAKYKDAIETVSTTSENLFYGATSAPNLLQKTRLESLEALAVKSRLVLSVPISLIDIDFLGQGHLADPKDKDYLSVFRLRTTLNVDNQADIDEGEFAAISGLLEPGHYTEDEQVGRLANSSSVNSTVKDLMRDAASKKKVLREKRTRLSKGSRVKQRATRAPTLESLVAQVVKLEGHLGGRMADIGVYSVKFGEDYNAKESIKVDKGVYSVTVPVETYDLVKDGLTVRAGSKTMTLAEAIEEMNTRTFDRRKELHSLIDARSNGKILTAEEQERIHKLESLLPDGSKAIELKATESVHLPSRVLAGVPSYWGDKDVIHPVSRKYFGMLLGTSVFTHEELDEAKEESELLHKLVGGGTKTHVEILEELLNKSRITNPNLGINTEIQRLVNNLKTITNANQKAFVKDRIKSLRAEVEDADTPEKQKSLKGFHNYFENIEEYEKLAEENPNESLNAFVKYIQDTFYNKAKIDPRVLVSYGRNAIYQTKEEIYSAIAIHDDNGNLGTSAEELAKDLSKDKTKLGLHLTTYGVEAEGSKGAKSDVRNFLVDLISDFQKGVPNAHAAVINSFLKAGNIRSAIEAVARASVTAEYVLGREQAQVEHDEKVESLDTAVEDDEGKPLDTLERLKPGIKAEEAPESLRVTVADLLRVAQSRQKDIQRYDSEYAAYLDKLDKGIKGEDGLRLKPPVPIERATKVPRMGGSYVEDAAVEEVRMQSRLHLITDILGREDQLKAELRQVQSRISTDPGSLSLSRRAEDLKAQIESEPNNRMRRLYGVRVTEDNQLAVVTPDDIERSLAEKTPIHFFGTHEEDVQRILANKTPQELIDIAHSVGLRSGVNLEGKLGSHFYTPEDDTYEHRGERIDQHLEFHPFDPKALHEKAFLQAQKGNLVEALHTITEASKADPNNAAISNSLKVLEDIEWRKNIPVYAPDLKAGARGVVKAASGLSDIWKKNVYEPYLNTRKVSGNDLMVNDLLDPNPRSLSHSILKEEAEEWANSHSNFSAELQSPAVRAVASEAYQTGVFRHVMFSGYVKPQDYVQDPSLTAEQNTKLEQLSQQRKLDYPMQQAGAPKGTLYAPANTPEDRLYQETLSGSSNTSPVHHTERVAAQEAAARDPQLVLERLASNPELRESVFSQLTAEGLSLEAGHLGNVEHTKDGFLTSDGRVFPISTEPLIERNIPLLNFVTALGANAPGQRAEDKHRGVINYESDSMKIYELTGTDPISGKTISRTLSYNHTVSAEGVASKGHLLGDAHERAIKFFTSGTQNIIVLDTETDRHTRSLFSTSILKIGADSKEMEHAENYTRSFYESKKLDYLQENKIDPDLFQLPGLRMDLQQKREQKELELEISRRNMKSRTSKDRIALQAQIVEDQKEIKAQALRDRKEIIAAEEAHFEKMNSGFKFTAKGIQTQEEQVIHYAELLRKGLRDGNTVVAAHNAEFDLSVLAENARSLADAHSLTTNMGIRLHRAANFFENVLPKHTIDTAHLLQIAHPDRTSTQLEKIAVDQGVLSPGEQTHTALADNRVAAEVVRLALSKDNPKKFESKEIQNLGVMIFTDEARDAILVHKILPIDLSVGRDKVQVVGRRVSFEALKDTEGLKAMYAEMEANNSGVLVKELTTGYQISQRRDQGRLHLLSLESAAERADEMEGYQAGAVRDHARRMVRNAISPGEKSRADWTDLSILRGKIAEGFDALTGDEAKKSYISSVMMAARTQTNSEDLPGIDFTEVTRSQVNHLRRFMSNDMYGSINESHFRKAVILAKDTLVERQGTVDKRFLEEVTPLLKDGSMSPEQYKTSRIAYTKLVNTISPSPKITLESQDVVPNRSVTLSSYKPSGTLRSTEIDLTHLNQDDIMQQLQSHADSVVPKMPNSMTEFQQRQVTMQRLTKDVRESSQAFKNIPLQQNIQGLANTILDYAGRNPSLGTKEGVLINDDLHVPEMRPSFNQDMDRELKYIGSTTDLPTALSAAPAREERQKNARINAEKERRPTLSRSEPAPQSSTEEYESPFSTQVPPMGQDSGYTGGSAPHRTVEAPELGENLSNTFRNIFTKATSMEITPENVKVGLAFAGGVTALGLTLLGIHQASRSSQKEAGAGDSDEAPMTADRVNRAAESDLRGGGSGDEAAEGYRKLKVTIRGSHLGIGGSRLSEEALQAISQDVSSTLQKHLGAELDPDGSIYGQSGQSAPARPWVINEVMGRILGKR